jgi:hypothetical protein
MNDQHLKDLRQNGYVVIENILPNQQCDLYINLIWDWLEGINSKISRHDHNTWTNKNWPENVKGIFQHYGVGHAQVMWDIRSEPSVIDTFKKIWSTDQLIVSFDGLNVMRPPKYNSKSITSYKYNMWWHTDQSFNKEGAHCIQGLVNLEESGREDGSFMVLKGSHNFHQLLHKTFNSKAKGDWYMLSKDEITWMKEQVGVEEVKVTAPKGAMVLWDSRTIHCNAPPIVQEIDKPKFRYACYVCMTPRSFISKLQLDRKIKAFNELRTTNHWPHQIKVNAIKPHSFGKEVVNPNYKIKEPTLSERAKKLCGITDYC